MNVQGKGSRVAFTSTASLVAVWRARNCDGGDDECQKLIKRGER